MKCCILWTAEDSRGNTSTKSNASWFLDLDSTSLNRVMGLEIGDGITSLTHRVWLESRDCVDR